MSLLSYISIYTDDETLSTYIYILSMQRTATSQQNLTFHTGTSMRTLLAQLSSVFFNT